MPRDASELARRLARDAEAVCRHYLSNGRRQGRYWLVGDVRNSPGRSIFVQLSGPESGPGAAGHWTDAASSEYGDLLDVGSLRFHPRCYYRPEGDGPTETWPAMVAAVTDLEGRITGAHRTWLAPDGFGKAPVATPPRAMGGLLGHTVRSGHLPPRHGQQHALLLLGPHSVLTRLE